jgi:hypothetical protein
MADNLTRITPDPAVLGGRPSIRGLRITVAHVVNFVANGNDAGPGCRRTAGSRSPRSHRAGPGSIDRAGSAARLGAAYCVGGGQAVNAYVDPLVSLDLDLAIAETELDRVLPAFAGGFRIERFPHRVNLTSTDSALRVQFRLDPRYADFVPRAERRPVLGIELPVATIEDVLQGKARAAPDTSRRASNRQKDLADTARLLERHPHLSDRVPSQLRKRVIED